VARSDHARHLDCAHSESDVLLGDGFNRITGQLVALKRQDQLAFVASASYQKSLKSHNLEPDD
jgi:hypothetical protein